MERVIKFRAWDRFSNRMIYSSDILVRITGELEWEASENKLATLGRPDVQLLQFTGLLGKNEKEIYEGDVDSFGWIVCFESGVFCVKQRIDARTFIPMHEANIKEIIGNIYENPELLK